MPGCFVWTWSMQSLADRSCLHSWARSHLRLCPAQQRSSTWHICCVMFSPAGVTSRCKWSRRAGSSPSWPRTRLSSVCGSLWLGDLPTYQLFGSGGLLGRNQAKGPWRHLPATRADSSTSPTARWHFMPSQRGVHHLRCCLHLGGTLLFHFCPLLSFALLFPGFPLSVCLLPEAFSSKPSVCFRGCVSWWPAFARLHQGHQGRALGRKGFYVGRSGPALICHGWKRYSMSAASYWARIAMRSIALAIRCQICGPALCVHGPLQFRRAQLHSLGRREAAWKSREALSSSSELIEAALSLSFSEHDFGPCAFGRPLSPTRRALSRSFRDLDLSLFFFRFGLLSLLRLWRERPWRWLGDLEEPLDSSERGSWTNLRFPNHMGWASTAAGFLLSPDPLDFFYSLPRFALQVGATRAYHPAPGP